MLQIYFRIPGHLKRFIGSTERDKGEGKMGNAREGVSKEAASREAEGFFLRKKGGMLRLGEVKL